MNISAPFITRPIATTLIMIAMLVVGFIGYNLLSVAALPSVDFPTVSISAQLPGADPRTMASAVAQPLERQFAQIPGVNQITSTSVLGTTNITLQFNLNRNVDGAAGDVQQAINAAQGYLPKNLPTPPTYRKVNPGRPAGADPRSDVKVDAADAARPVRRSQRGATDLDSRRRRPSHDLRRAEIRADGDGQPAETRFARHQLDRGRKRDHHVDRRHRRSARCRARASPTRSAPTASSSCPPSLQRRSSHIATRAPVRVGDVAKVSAGVDSPFQASWVGASRGEMIGIWRQPGAKHARGRRQDQGAAAEAAGRHPAGDQAVHRQRPLDLDPRQLPGREDHAGGDDRAGHHRHLHLPARVLGDDHSRADRAALGSLAPSR